MAKKKPVENNGYGTPHPYRPNVFHRPTSPMEEIVNNIVMSRSQMMRNVIDPNRDYNKECGYPETQELISYGPTGSSSVYRRLYDREAIAARVVEVLPEESWRTQPSVFETDDGETNTPFEEAWDKLAMSLGGESWYQDEKGNPIWEYLKRVDILSGIGSYGLLLMGIDDGKDLSEPVDGMEDKKSGTAFSYVRNEGDEQSDWMSGKAETDPRATMEGDQVDEDAKDSAASPQGGPDKGPNTQHKLIYLRAFDESLVQVAEFERNRKNPRYGLPIRYIISINDPVDTHGGIGIDLQTVRVHWSRVIHVTDHLMTNEVYGIPRMRPVINRLFDLIKLYGGSAEMYWKGAFPGMALTTHPSLGGDVKVDETKTKDQLEDWQNSLQRYLIFAGMEANMLSPTVVDPTAQIEVQIQAICIKLGIPQRIFMGSERGELSSGQDATEWNNRLSQRQQMYLTPRLIVPFVNRLIQMGVLPKPKGFSVTWPKPHLAPQDQANLGNIRTTALAAYMSGGVNNLIPPIHYLVDVLGFDEEEAEAMLEKAVEDITSDDLQDTDDPLKIKEGQDQEAQAEQQKQQMDAMQQKSEADNQKFPPPAPTGTPVKNAFCPTGEGGGVDPTCRKDGTKEGLEATAQKIERNPGASEHVKREIVDRASQIQFSDEPHPVQEEVGPMDWDGIEERMTDEEKDEMQDQLDEWRDDNINNSMDDYEPPEISADDAAEEAGYDGESVEDSISEMVEKHAESFEDEDDLETARQAITDWRRQSGLDGIDDLTDSLGENLPDDLRDDLKNYRSDAVDKIIEAEKTLADNARDAYREELKSDYDSRDDRIEYLREFRSDNIERYEASTEAVQKDVWAKDQAEDSMSLKFSTSNGKDYSIDVREHKIGGITTHDVEFNDESGSTSKERFGVTGAGNAHEVFGKVVPSIVAYAQKMDPTVMSFSAAEPSRQKLYDRLVKTVARVLPDYKAVSADMPGKREYVIVRRGSDADEKIQSHFGDKARVIVNRYADIAKWWDASAWIGG